MTAREFNALGRWLFYKLQIRAVPCADAVRQGTAVFYFVPVSSLPFTYSLKPFEITFEASPSKLVT